MLESEPVWAIKRLLIDYLQSPSLRHLRAPHAVNKLAAEIVRELDRSKGIWQKWDGPRVAILQRALPCWIPTDDLLAYLNNLPGPKLTRTDLLQRIRAIEEEGLYQSPQEELKLGCTAIYVEERAAGTEMTAIIGRLADHAEEASQALYEANKSAYRKHREEEKVSQERRLLSGADCPWTQMRGSKCWYCRRNGRTFRISPAKEGRWNLTRVKAVDDMEHGEHVGVYAKRGDATSVLAKLAYEIG